MLDFSYCWFGTTGFGVDCEKQKSDLVIGGTSRAEPAEDSEAEMTIVQPSEVNIERGGFHLLDHFSLFKFHSPTAGLIFFWLFILFVAVAGGIYFYKRRNRHRRQRRAREEEDKRRREEDERLRRLREEEDRERLRFRDEEWGYERYRRPPRQMALTSWWDQQPTAWPGYAVPRRAAVPPHTTAEAMPLAPMDAAAILQRVLAGVLEARPDNRPRFREENDAPRQPPQDE